MADDKNDQVEETPLVDEGDQISTQIDKLEILLKTTTDKIVELRDQENQIIAEIEQMLSKHGSADKVEELRARQTEIHIETEQLTTKLTKIEFDLSQLKQPAS